MNLRNIKPKPLYTTTTTLTPISAQTDTLTATSTATLNPSPVHITSSTTRHAGTCGAGRRLQSWVSTSSSPTEFYRAKPKPCSSHPSTNVRYLSLPYLNLAHPFYRILPCPTTTIPELEAADSVHGGGSWVGGSTWGGVG